MVIPTADLALLLGTIATVLAGLASWLLLRGRRSQANVDRLALAVQEKQHIPPSLHPVIDPDICIGSLSCIRACPEGDILGIVSGKAKLVEASHCIGHSKCAVECPVDAIKLVFGTHEKGMDLPETDERFESSRPGVYIVGELGGMGLIKNALRQGLNVARTLHSELGGAGGAGDVVDVAVVGAGPAGIAAAVGCREAGLSFRVLEQGTVGGTVANYPRNKVVMTEQVRVPYLGVFGRTLISKEELIEQFEELLEKAQVQVDEGTKVESVDGEKGAFTVNTSRGPVRARSIVLATGLRGSPRKLGVPGEDGTKVTYRLIDPAQYAKKRVLIVGGGDSAVEAAIQLANEAKAKVTISYRKDSFSRAKPRNRELIADLVAQKRVRAVMSSQVQRIDSGHVLLKTGDGEEGKLKNDHVIVCIGGELPTKFLESAGVQIKRFHGEARGEVVRGSADNRRLAAALTGIGAVILAALTWVGGTYYLLPEMQREDHALHELLRPAGLWGHGVGVIATLFMMSNFIYALRKRWKKMKGSAHIRTWLTFHVFVGLMSPAVIAFHAAFQSRNLLATGTWTALAIVVGTGVFGRFLFGLVPSAEGRLLSLRELQTSLAKFRDEISPIVHEVTNPAAVQELLDEAMGPPPERIGLLSALLWLRRRRYALRRLSDRSRPFFSEPDDFYAFREGLGDLARLRLQVALYEKVKPLFRVWLGFHIVLSLFMVVLIAAHVAVSLYLGYGWVLTDA